MGLTPAPLSNGHDIAVEANCVIDLADNWRIRQYRDGELKTLAGSVQGHLDGPAADALFRKAWAIKAAPDRSLIIGDWIYLRQLRDGMVTTIAGREHPLPFLGPQDGPAQEAVLLGVTAVAIKVGLKDGPLAEAEFDHPRSIAVDDKGNLYVADSGNCRIRYVQLH